MKTNIITTNFFSKLEKNYLYFKKELKGFFGGKTQTKQLGDSMNFFDYKEYVIGDDIRKIDWNLYARLEKHFIKLYTDEKQINIDIYIDYSSSMQKAYNKKSVYALQIAAAFGFLGLKNMDKISFKVLKESNIIDNFVKINNQKTFMQNVATLEEIDFNGDTKISDAVLKNKSKIKKNGIVILISDFLTDNDYKKAIDYFIYQNKQVVLVQVLAKEEIQPNYLGNYNLIDSESIDIDDAKNLRIKIDQNLYKAYEIALSKIINDLKDFSKSRNIVFLFFSTGEEIEKAFFLKLLKEGVLL